MFLHAENKDIINVKKLPEKKDEPERVILDAHDKKSRDIQNITETTKVPKLQLIPEAITPLKREARGFPFLNLLKRKEKKSG